MKNQAFALAFLLCSAGAFAQTHKLFGINESVFSVTADGETVEAISPLVDPAGGLTFFDGKLYGVTKSGGENGYGTIYWTNIDGTGHEVIYDFTESEGSPLAGLVVTNGQLWGTTATGGSNSGGTIFYTTAGAGYINVGHNFTPATNGNAVAGPLVESNGVLWGTTSLGGTNDVGTVFTSNPSLSGYLELIHTFAAAEGANPKGALLPFGGFLYGVTENGGTNSLGAIYKIALSDNAYTKVRDLATADGTNPIGGLVESGGLLIGMTQNGGANGLGTIFTIDPADGDAFDSTIDLDETTGGNPKGALTSLGGVLYGLTSSEGANEMGTYFSLTADGATLEVLHDFDEATGGSPINATLIQVNQAPVMLEPVLLEFNEDDVIEPVDLAAFFDDPESPGSELTYALASGLPEFIYAISFDGSEMTVELVENEFGEFTAVVNVTDADGATLEAEMLINVNPVAETGEISTAYTSYLTENSTGLEVYKSFLDGDEVTHVKVTGINNGTLFDANGVEIEEGNFVALADIAGGMKFLSTGLGEIHFNIQLATGDNDDYLGGEVVQATVNVSMATPEITWPDPPDIFLGDPLTELHLNASTETPGTFTYNLPLGYVLQYGQFQGLNVLFEPEDAEHYNSVTIFRHVTVYAQSTLLGLGATDGGSIFTYASGESSLEHVAAVPTTGTNGHNPNGELLMFERKHYGTMQAGGANGHGTIYYMNASGTGLTKMHDFDGTDGSKPVRGLFYDNYTELLWGVTYEGGAHNFGVIFSIEPSGENFVKRHDFDGTNGKYPDGGFAQWGSGTLYGTTTLGGSGYGVMYAFHPNDNSFEVLKSFEQTECITPRGALVATNSQLFGVTQSGGEFGYGAIFKSFLDGTGFTILHSFNDEDGSSPMSGLSQRPNSYNFFGTTSTGGGVNHSGTVYHINTSEQFEVIHRFANTGSTNPTGLLSFFDGRIWGMTSAGGANGKGALFTLRPTGTDNDFHEVASLSVNDGADHINGSIAFVGTPPWIHDSSPIDVGEDVYVPQYLYNIFRDAEGDLAYVLLSNTNPGLLEPSFADGQLNLNLVQDHFGSAELEIKATDSEGGTVSTMIQVNVLPAGDQPSVTGAVAYVGEFNTEGLVVTRNEVDGEECTHFRVYHIEGGELYYNDEVTQINDLDFVPYTEGALGLKFRPTSESGTHNVNIQGAVGPSDEYLSYTSTFADISVSKHNSTITWETPDPIFYGTALSEVQLNATSDVPGTFVYSLPLGEVLGLGSHFMDVNFTPDDAEHYYDGYQYVYIEVIKQTPVITWSDPQNIPYGTPLSEVQLNATVDVEGDLIYSQPLGTILEPGTQELTVYLDNYDTEHYATPSAVTVNITVDKLTPVGTWEDPAPIPYGTPLSELQLNATFDVGGDAYYSESIGTWWLEVGTHTITVNFSPYDGDHYNFISLSVELTVEKATPVITWEPADITYGDVLWVNQLNASTDVGGDYVYSHSYGDVLDAGTQTLTLDFIPFDATNYNSVLGLTRAITVAKATPAVYWDNTTITYGTLLAEWILDAYSPVTGTFSYHEALGELLEPGEHTLTADFTPTDEANYESVMGITMTLTVEKAVPSIAWNPAGITYGTPLGSEHLNASSDVDGTFSYQPGEGQVLDAGLQSLSVDFEPADGTRYEPVSLTIQIEVAKADQSISSFASLPSNLTFGDEPIDLSAVASSGLAVVFASSDESVISVSGAVATINGAGTATLTASQPGDNNYNAAEPQEQTVNVAKGSQVITFVAIENKQLGDAAFSLDATSTSNLTVEFSTTSDKATISESVVTIVAAGRVSITAAQPGNANYLAATVVEQSFCITPETPVVTANDDNPDAPVLTSSSSVGNQWFLNGTAISGATGPGYTVAAAGEYTVQVSVDDCTSLTSAPVAFMVTAILQESAQISMIVYPNPAADEIHVSWRSHDAEPRMVALYDLLGREVEKRRMDGDELSIDVRSLSRGTYLVLGSQGATRLQQRFVKE